MMYFFLTIFFFLAMMGYIRLANKYNIIDKPNERSSHSTITIRGGGVIFILAAAVVLVSHFQEFWLPAMGILLIGTISFLDDIYALSNKIRILFHLIAVTCLFFYTNAFTAFPFYLLIGLYIIVIGVINAYNFMDGINGITGVYSLVVLTSLQYMNLYRVAFTHPDMIWLPILACLVFLFFNFRKKAICFAGDVGSVVIAFWIMLLMLDLIFTSGNWVYLLFLTVYGVDTVLTILHRLLLKQNIFHAHRLHFYQILANDKKISHLLISAGYGMLQLLINAFVIFSTWNTTLIFILICVPLIFIYVGLKNRLMVKKVAL